jgi:hypothetical protein
MGKCADYQKYVHPSLFPDCPGRDIVLPKTRRKRIVPENIEPIGQEQLTFGFSVPCQNKGTEK